MGKRFPEPLSPQQQAAPTNDATQQPCTQQSIQQHAPVLGVQPKVQRRQRRPGKNENIPKGLTGQKIKAVRVYVVVVI